MKSNSINLRPIKPKDAEALAKQGNNPKIAENLQDIFPQPYKLDNAHFFINLIKDQSPTSTFVIEYENQFAGIISIIPQQDIYRYNGLIGYWLGEEFWNKQIMSTAVKLAIDYAFDVLKLTRIYTGVFEYNTSSMKVLEKNGFQKEYIAKKALFKNNTFWDEHRYALNKSDITS